MGAYFSLSRVSKDKSYIRSINEDFIDVDFDLKEKFFVEYIDDLHLTSQIFFKILENEEAMRHLGLKPEEFLFLTLSGNFMDGDNVEKFFEPEKILLLVNKIIADKDYLNSIKIINNKLEEENLKKCREFLSKAIAENCYVQFYWQ